MTDVFDFNFSPVVSLDFGSGKAIHNNHSDYRPSTCSKPSSSYWKVPDESQYLTSIAVHDSQSLCAAASGSRKENLFIYELNAQHGHRPMLTHHQTISLPEIHSLAWVSPSTTLGSHGNVLVSGHKSGLIHMTLLPDTHSSNTPAEILKRFNHTRHLPSSAVSTRIRNLALTSSSWSTFPSSGIVSLCSDHLFLWDPTRSDLPLIKQKLRGDVVSMDLCGLRNGIVAFGGRKGVSIRDLRVKSGSGLSPPDSTNEHATVVKWSPHNDNLVASVHDGKTIKVWDIRSSGPVSSYSGHSDWVTAVEWALHSSSEIISASNDGTIRVWDSSKESLVSKSVASRPAKPSSLNWAPTNNWKNYQQRQFNDWELDTLARDILAPSQPMVSQNKQFTSLKVADKGAISIDTDGYFGYHLLQESPYSPHLSSDEGESSDNDFLPPFSPL